MPPRARRQLAVALAGVVAIALAPAPAIARNLALVVGNDAYRDVAKLHTAVGDAQAIGDTLERLGFVVRRAIDADRNAMSRALSAFDADLQPGDQAFFFYSGHGLEISGTNYLLPTDVPAARMNQRDLVRDAGLPVEQIIDGIRERGVRVAILVLDACRDNPFAAPGTRAAATTGGLARVEAADGVFVLMSAGAKQEALDRLAPGDATPNSVFTRTFLRELAEPGRTMVQIAKATQVKVRDLAATVGYEQTPAYYDQVIGDIVLSRSLSPGAENGAPAARPPHPAAPVVASADPTAPAPAAGPPPPTSLPVPAMPAVPGPAALQLGGRAPIASFMRSNAGWTVTVSLPEPALAFSFRLGDAGEFRSTGLSDSLDERTGERRPNLSFPLPARATATIIQVRYTTQEGGMVGPFAIRFDPDAALFGEQKKILEQIASTWAQFREFNGLLVYFTTLVTYRCAIAELRYGLDGAAPLARYDLPACNAADPFSIPPDATLLMRVPPATRSINVQIVWRDGTRSDVNTIARD